MKIEFYSEIWRSPGKSGWYFVSLPIEQTNNIRNNYKEFEEGWGRLRCLAQIDDLSWATAIWFDSKSHVYLLPIKAKIRKELNVAEHSKVNVIINLEDEGI